MSAEATTTTYVTYLLPGIFMAEESTKQVNARDPQRQANKAPTNAYAFFYFDVVTTTVAIGGEHIVTSSGQINISKTYYINAELLTSEQVAALPGDYSTLLTNMRINNWDPIARCRTGNFQPYEADKYELITTN